MSETPQSFPPRRGRHQRRDYAQETPQAPGDGQWPEERQIPVHPNAAAWRPLADGSPEGETTRPSTSRATTGHSGGAVGESLQWQELPSRRARRRPEPQIFPRVTAADQAQPVSPDPHRPSQPQRTAPQHGTAPQQVTAPEQVTGPEQVTAPEQPQRPAQSQRPAAAAPAAPVAAPVRPTKPGKPAKRRSWGAKLTTFVVILALLAAVGGAGYYAATSLGVWEKITGPKDYPGPGSGEVTITIPEGATGRSIGVILADADVVASADAFVNAFNANNFSTSIQPGNYLLKREMKATDVVTALLDPNTKVDHSRVTLIPGTTVKAFTDKLVEQGIFDADQVAAAVADPAALGVPAQANGNLEGWLAPDTFQIGEKTTVKQLFTQMVEKTKSNLKEAGISEGQWQEALIKGSIVEKEVFQPEYYSKVVTVMNNRLDTPNETAGFLGMDSTVLYGVGKSGGTPTAADLAQDTPYNTRLHKGLPPTPIGAVSLPVLKAVGNPEPGPWLYFVTVNLDTGETRFSATNDEFQKDVAAYRAYCAQSGKC